MRKERGKANFFPALGGLLGTNLNRQLFAALFAAGSNNLTAIFGFHALAISMGFCALFLTGLPRAFHKTISDVCGRLRNAFLGGSLGSIPKRYLASTKKLKSLSSLTRFSWPNSLVRPSAFLLSMPNIFSSSSKSRRASALRGLGANLRI
jgi:hypothetical protein